MAMLASTSLATPLRADENEPRAGDARRLADESVATQAAFFITWGVQAPARWAEEHNSELVLAQHPSVQTPDQAQTTVDGAIVTPIAFQAFEHGFMLWRKDDDHITVGYTNILTKTQSPCQETYRDTYRGQPFDVPAAPAGTTVPRLGFGWLYANDAQLASHLGFATGDEVSRVAEIRSRSTDVGGQVVELTLSQPIDKQSNPLAIAQSDEPGLTYCFARGNENRAVLNTWVAVQRFEHGLMSWRQDRPNHIEVVHADTELAPELGCLDIIEDTWMPGQVLDLGEVQSDRRLPERGFGKVWLIPYVRQSLGYPLQAETGGFAQLTFERFNHPKRGPILIRQTDIQLPGGVRFSQRAFFPGGGDPQREDVLSQGCSRILIPHVS